MVEIGTRSSPDLGLLNEVRAGVAAGLNSGIAPKEIVNCMIAAFIDAGVPSAEIPKVLITGAMNSGMPKGDVLASMLEESVDSGIQVNEVATMVINAAYRSMAKETRVELLPMRPYPVYAEVPEGCIDLPSAAKKYGLNIGTVREWVRQGRVAQVGRLKAPAPGGGYLLVNEKELQTCIGTPRAKGGRPRKTPVAAVEL